MALKWPMLHALLSFCLATISRAALLMAYSEFLFLNEEPVKHLVGAQSFVAGVGNTLAFLLYYCLAGALLVVLEPLMTTWRRTILAGAFVGWSIEAAMVPAAYEAVPLSYFWTSVAWHAVVDVALGCVLVQRVLALGTVWQRAALALGLGLFWALWATWPWAEYQLDATQFGILAGTVLALWGLGYSLTIWPSLRVSPGRRSLYAVASVNLAFWALWASLAPLAAAGLAVLALITGYALARAPSGAAPLTLTVAMRPRDGLWLVGATLIAYGGYTAMLQGTALLPAEDMVSGCALLGIGLYAWALVGAFRRSHHLPTDHNRTA